MFISMQKMKFIPNFFLRFCKNIANLLLWVLWECLNIPINNHIITLKKLWWPKCCNQLVGNFDVYLHAKDQLHVSLLVSDIVKALQTYYMEKIRNAWPSPSKIIVSICKKLSCLSTYKKSNLITHFCLKIFQRNNKQLHILGTLRMSCHTNLRWYCQNQENFDVYMQAKSQLHPLYFPWDIVKILQTCYFG